MKQKKLNKTYVELLEFANNANGRKETVSILHKAEKIRTKIYKKTNKKCSNCYGMGFRRISINETKTCLKCFGKGYVNLSFQSSIPNN